MSAASRRIGIGVTIAVLAVVLAVLAGVAVYSAFAPRPASANPLHGVSFYVDPARVDPEHLLPSELSRFLGYVKSTTPIDASEPVLLPGEPEARRRADRIVNGVPLTEETCEALRATARAVAVSDALHLQSA